MSGGDRSEQTSKELEQDPLVLWKHYQALRCECPSLGLSLDLSRLGLADSALVDWENRMQEAYAAMASLEQGAIANPDEQRMVGHYWLRAPETAPDNALTAEIQATIRKIESFAADVHNGTISPQTSARFTRVLSIGIGGSALGPMFVADALGDPKRDRMAVHFLDNTDPDGIDRELKRLEQSSSLSETLCLVISKSGSTPEPRNAMLHVVKAYQDQGLDFAKHAVAITGTGSLLDNQALREGWLVRFPMWDWVGGRTSVTGPVGLVPAALQGLDIRALIEGAAACDRITRQPSTAHNPAALLAIAWHHASAGVGAKDMVVLPYKDRLLLFSRYLQQLIMESLGKRLNLKGERVDQGLSVYGNKGSTDQHAYVQQLRDGVNNFFAVFLRVLHDGGEPLAVEPGTTAGDYLHGFWMGTREALYANGRPSLTITIDEVNARAIGVLIALFERAVGFYATLVGINAYHQPGVEAGKKAAAAVLVLQHKVIAALGERPDTACTASALAATLGQPLAVESIFLTLEHLHANGKVRRERGAGPADWEFVLVR